GQRTALATDVAATRSFLPHCGQVTTCPAVCAPAGVVPVPAAIDPAAPGCAATAAWANAPQVEKRALGSFARPRATTAARAGVTPGATSGGASLVLCWSSTAAAVAPVNGGRPLRNS